MYPQPLFLPRSVAFTVYEDDVAPEIVEPFAFHRYDNDAFDAHVPAVAVSFLPTWAVPEIVEPGWSPRRASPRRGQR